MSLAACMRAEPELYPPPPYGATPPVYAPPSRPVPRGPGGPVAILLPLTGPNAQLGQAMLNAARLALEVPGAPKLDVRDTGGTTTGADQAAEQAIAAGDRIILGPLTAIETEAVAGPARAAGVPVLAFTSDPAQARPGVWTLGLTPGQQVRRLVGASVAKGKNRFAGLLPDNEFGHAMESALVDATQSAGVPAPKVTEYTANPDSMTQQARDLAEYAQRHGPAGETPAGMPLPANAAGGEQPHPPVSPPPFDALLLAATGPQLGELATALGASDVTPAQVQILGPALWAQPGARGSHNPFLDGAWYAAPDPAARAPFVAQYRGKYGATPPRLADLAYDAAAIARLDHQRGYSPSLLTRPNGFAGVDGLIALLPDGQVRRALALFEIRNGGAKILERPPSSLRGPGV